MGYFTISESANDLFYAVAISAETHGLHNVHACSYHRYSSEKRGDIVYLVDRWKRRVLCEIKGIGLDYGQISELVLEAITAHEAQLKKEEETT